MEKMLLDGPVFYVLKSQGDTTVKGCISICENPVNTASTTYTKFQQASWDKKLELMNGADSMVIRTMSKHEDFLFTKK